MTDTTRSMIVCGRQLSFPIDLSHETAVCLTGNEKWTETYAANQAQLLLHSREIAHLLIDETCCYHQEKMNELRPDLSVTKWAALFWQNTRSSLTKQITKLIKPSMHTLVLEKL